MARTSAVWILVVLLGVSAAGQQAGPRFDVASVRENLIEQPPLVSETPTGVRIQAATVVLLISRAFGISEREILGGPNWIRTRRFDISARTEAGVKSRDEVWQMVRTLLEDRFELKVERVQDEHPAYALVVARKDRRLGPSLKPATSSCLPQEAFPPSELEMKGNRLIVGTRCGMNVAGSGTRQGDNFRIIYVYGSRVTMPEFASALSGFLDRPVTDRTELAGGFDVAVVPSRVLSTSPSSPGDALGGDLKFFAAVEDQLGLKLQPTRTLVDVVKILSVQFPTPND